jgi:hypothetical protein
VEKTYAALQSAIASPMHTALSIFQRAYGRVVDTWGKYVGAAGCVESGARDAAETRCTRVLGTGARESCGLDGAPGFGAVLT